MEPSDFLKESEVRELLGVSKRTIERYRATVWYEGIHFVKPVHGIKYVKPMIVDWMINGRSNPAAHQRAMEEWLAQHQHQGKRRKAG